MCISARCSNCPAAPPSPSTRTTRSWPRPAGTGGCGAWVSCRSCCSSSPGAGSAMLAPLAAATGSPTAEQIGTWVGRTILGPGLLLLAAGIFLLFAVFILGRGRYVITVLVVLGVVTFMRIAPSRGLGSLDGALPRPQQAERPSRDAAAIPAGYLTLYQRAPRRHCPGLPWTILAGIGKVESNHGRSRLPGVRSGWNQAGAAGPMQFGIGVGKAGDSWAKYGR